MKKQEFLSLLNKELFGLPSNEVAERINFYSEMIDDSIEDGLSEEQAVEKIGSVKEISSQITADIPLSKIISNRLQPKRRLQAWEIVLIILGLPITLSIGVSIFAVIISVYASLWTGVISLWSAFISLVACCFAGVAGCIMCFILGNSSTAIAILGAELVCSGLSVFILLICKLITKWTIKIPKQFILLTKKIFRKKEQA